MDELALVPSLPPSWYHSSSQFLAEKEKIFKKEWTLLCHSQELPHAGDYITCDVAGVPVIALRDFQEEIQVLLNVCSHRAAPILTKKKGRLEKPVLMCQYHGWCYRTDGSFKQAPSLTSSSENLDLKKISYSEVKGMIFVSFNANPPPFEGRKEQIVKEMIDSQFKIEEYKFHSKMIREGDFNWKVWVEGFQECYHCPTIHPIFKKDFDLGKYQVINKDQFSVHQCPRKGTSSTGTFEGLWLWLFPNSGLPCYEKVYYSMRVNPISANRTELTYTFFTNNQFDAKDESQFFDFIKQITDEDFDICERVQKNLEEVSGTPLYEHGYINPARENGVQYFHQLVRNAIDPLPIDKIEQIIKLKETAL